MDALSSDQMEEMVNRLFGVIRDSLKMKQMSWDPERTAELYVIPTCCAAYDGLLFSRSSSDVNSHTRYYQISQGFIDSPDLRVTWLENLSAYHTKVYIIEVVEEIYHF